MQTTATEQNISTIALILRQYSCQSLSPVLYMQSEEK